MAPTPVPAPRIRAPRIIAVLTAVAAAAGYAAMRMSVTGAVHLPFTGLCERLRVDPQPGDWWCHMSQTRMTVAFVGASLLVGLAIALPCAILAATGRRWSALFPLAIPLAVAGAWRGFLTVQSLIWIDRPGPSPSSPFLGIWQTWTMNLGGNGYWIEHPATAAGVDAVLLAVPALAISRAVRARRGGADAPERPRGRAALISFFACGAAVAGVLFVAFRVHSFSSDELAALQTGRLGWVVPAAVMTAFGMTLGTDRRWWPWALVPVALLLTTAAPMLIALALVHHSDYGAFGFALAVPLTAVGLAASFWRPLADRLARAEVDDAAEVAAPQATRPGARRRFRPVVALNAIAVGLLATSIFAQATNPVGLIYSYSLPTFLGERAYVQDLRARMNLDQGLAALEAYRSANGTFRGFTAGDGKTAVPEMSWVRGIPLPNGNVPRPLVVGIASATSSSAELFAFSASGRAYCLRDGGVVATYGDGGSPLRPDSPRGPQAQAAAALAACGATPWGSDALRPFPIDDLCAGMAPQDEGIKICRAVQVLMLEIISTPKVPY